MVSLLRSQSSVTSICPLVRKSSSTGCWFMSSACLRESTCALPGGCSRTTPWDGQRRTIGRLGREQGRVGGPPFKGATRAVRSAAIVPAGSVLLIDLTLGVALLATIGFAATRSPLAAQVRHRRLVGWLLVAVPLPLVVAFRVALPSSPFGAQAAFGCGVLAFAVGALLVLSGRGDDHDPGSEHDPGPTPWWPDFEGEFRVYVREQSRCRVRI